MLIQKSKAIQRRSQRAINRRILPSSLCYLKHKSINVHRKTIGSCSPLLCSPLFSPTLPKAWRHCMGNSSAKEKPNGPFLDGLEKAVWVRMQVQLLDGPLLCSRVTSHAHNSNLGVLHHTTSASSMQLCLSLHSTKACTLSVREPKC